MDDPSGWNRRARSSSELQSTPTNAPTIHSHGRTITNRILRRAATIAPLVPMAGCEIIGVEKRLGELRDRAARLPEDARIGLNATIDQLNTQKNELQERINELGNTSEAAWEDVKNGVSQAWDDLDEAVDSAADRFTGG